MRAYDIAPLRHSKGISMSMWEAVCGSLGGLGGLEGLEGLGGLGGYDKEI